MKQHMKTRIKNIIENIDYHLEEIDKKIEEIWQLIDGQADEEEEGEGVEAEKEVENELEIEENQNGEGNEMKAPNSPALGNCPYCGSKLNILSAAPLKVECSNVNCANRFPRTWS